MEAQTNQSGSGGGAAAAAAGAAPSSPPLPSPPPPPPQQQQQQGVVYRTSLRMNPYVRCVTSTNTLPEIRSIKELLAIKGYADPAENDTPCLRPSSTPASVQQAAAAGAGATATVTVMASVSSPAAGSGGIGATKTTTTTTTAPSPRLGSGSAGRAPGAQGQRRGGHPSSVDPSPMLTFTADGVATPNTFATANRHQKEVIAAAAASSNKGVTSAGEENPLGGRTAVAVATAATAVQISSTSGRTTTAGTGSGGGGATSQQQQHGRNVSGGTPSAYGSPGLADLDDTAMLLPSSTVEIAAASGLQRQQQLESSGGGVRSSSTSQRSHSGNTSTSVLPPHPHPGSSGSSAMTAAAASPTPPASLLSPPLAGIACCDDGMPSADVADSQLNERIISPRSLDLQGGCGSGGRGSTPTTTTEEAGVRTATTSQQQQQSAPLNRFLQRVDSGGNNNADATVAPKQQQQTHHTTTVVAVPPPPRPVARIETSPYHYIIRNYVGGSFLYYASAESTDHFLAMCYSILAQVTPIFERETIQPDKGLFPALPAPAFVLGDIHGNFGDLAYFLRQIVVFHDFNLTPANILCLGDYVDRGPFSLECLMLLFSLKIMNAGKIVLLRGNHEDRVVCGDLQTYGRGCFAAQCQTVFGYGRGMKLFRAVTALFRYLPLACELVVPYAPNRPPPAAAAAATASASAPAAAPHHRHQSNDSNPITAAAATTCSFVSAEGKHSSSSRSSRSNTTTTNSSNSHHYHHHLHHQRPTVHENLYVSQVCIPIQPPTPLLSAAPVAATTTTGHGNGSGGGGTALTSSPSSSSSAASSHGDGSSPVPLTTTTHQRQQPPPARRPGGGRFLRQRTHEERILCTHGGIPRFFGPPLEEDSLSFLRSPQFPRLLTLFPNNFAAKADPECAPDYYNRCLAERLKRAYLPRPPCGCYCDGCVAASADEEEVEEVAAVNITSNGVYSEYYHQSQYHAHHYHHNSNSNQQQQRRGTSTCCSSGSDSNDDTDKATPPSTSSPPRQRCTRHLECIHNGAAAAKGGNSSGGCPPHQPQTLEEIISRGWYVTFDLMWSDPTPNEAPTTTSPHHGPHTQPGSGNASATTSAGITTANDSDGSPVCRTNEWGFGFNSRGSNVISFSAKAVDTFLAAYQYSMLFRAHQEKAHGLRWGKNKKVLTIFSSSDYLGHGNGAGCVAVSTDGEVQMIEKMSDTRA